MKKKKKKRTQKLVIKVKFNLLIFKFEITWEVGL